MHNRRDYTLNFFEAIEACLEGKGFIRGEEFAPGIFAKLKDNVIVVVNAVGMFHELEGPLQISFGLRHQLFKLFSVASKKELDIE